MHMNFFHERGNASLSIFGVTSYRRCFGLGVTFGSDFDKADEEATGLVTRVKKPIYE